ncbi:MAG: hypothetical protein AAGF79_00580 [Pseudomonadota bacterium]
MQRFFEVVTFERLATGALNLAMTSARAFADIRYQQISFDPIGARLTLLDLDVRPFLPGMAPDACVVTAERLALRGQPLDDPGTWRAQIALDAVEVGLGCLPPPARAVSMGAGLDRITLPRVDMGLHYDYASGGGTMELSADLDRVAAIEVVLEADYISFRVDPARGEPHPALDLNAVHVTLDDRGGWDIAQRLLPPDIQSPDTLQGIVAGAVMQALQEANGTGETGAPMTADQQRFAAQAGAVAKGFAEGNRRVVLATQIARPPFRIDETSTANFPAFFDALSPVVSHRAPQLTRVIPVSDLQAALNSEETPADAVSLGRALLTGIGAPRNTNQGLTLLAKASREGNGEAAYLVADALAQSDPDTAYGHALRAAGLNYPGGLAVLDRVERATSYDTMMALQSDATPAGPDPALYGSVLQMRLAARGFLNGTDRFRSYRAAYYWAAMAAAAGDASGAAMRDDITETMRLRGDAQAWAQEAGALDNGVLRDWIQQDLPARLQ